MITTSLIPLMSRVECSSKNSYFSRVAKYRKSHDCWRYLRFFAVFCSDRVADVTKFAKIAKNRKSDDF